MKIKETTRKLRVLDFDIENRPLSYWYDGNPTAEVTAIAWGWHDEEAVHVRLLRNDDPLSPVDMLLDFCAVYEEADLVTGHYIRNHDLPIINGALMEAKLQPLSPKLTHCTKNDLVKRSGLSMAQEALGAMYGLAAPKYHMTQQMWRDANRLTEEGLELTCLRVTEDVRQHKELYRVLQEHRVLKAPRVWRP